MKREDLRNLGLTDEQVGAVMSLHGSTTADLQAITAERDSLQTQLIQRDSDIDSLKKANKGNKALQDQIKALEDQNASQKTAWEQEKTQLKLEYAVDNALAGAKVRNSKAAKALLNMDDIKFNEDGKLDGIDAQLEAIKESDAYLFDFGTNTQYKPSGGEAAGQDQVAAFQTAFGLDAGK